VFETEQLGLVAMVVVGMYDISSIALAASVAPGKWVAKGQELGHFAYGGSQIITFFQQGRLRLDPDVNAGSMSQRNVGQRYGIAVQSDAKEAVESY
jgi:phosphatidylserine decarboxylase